MDILTTIIHILVIFCTYFHPFSSPPPTTDHWHNTECNPSKCCQCRIFRDIFCTYHPSPSPTLAGTEPSATPPILPPQLNLILPPQRPREPRNRPPPSPSSSATYSSTLKQPSSPPKVAGIHLFTFPAPLNGINQKINQASMISQ